jgi:hypothetical protein
LPNTAYSGILLAVVNQVHGSGSGSALRFCLNPDLEPQKVNADPQHCLAHRNKISCHCEQDKSTQLMGKEEEQQQLGKLAEEENSTNRQNEHRKKKSTGPIGTGKGTTNRQH